MSPSTSNLLQRRLEELFGRINYERQDRPTPDSFKLKNMRQLMSTLGSPHLDYPVIHVAGTKGKGSVVAMIGSILQQANIKVGVYTSPHLESFNQRMKIQDHPIPDERLLTVIDKIAPFVKKMDEGLLTNGYRSLTFFEVSTAIMFSYFSEENVDFAVVEVGMGGRLDSTNVCEPVATTITNISFDHTVQLGNTIEKIATEKAGIIKNGVPLVCNATEPDAVAAILCIAKERQATCILAGRDFFCQSSNSDLEAKSEKPNREFEFSSTFEYPPVSLRHLTCGLLGEHQVHNAGAAIATVFAIPQLKNVVSEQAIRDGIANVKFAGRIEQIAASLPDGRRTILLDIAHNAASASALAETIASEQAFADVSFDARRLLFACSEDKDIKAILAPLLPLFGTICFTRFLENPRSCCPDQLIALANEIIDENQLPRPAMTKETDPNNGAEFLLENSAPSDLVVIAGSVFLVAELRKWACELSFSLGSAAS